MKRVAIAWMGTALVAGLPSLAMLPSQAWAQAMVEVPNAPPPPPPQVARQHRGPSRYELIVEVTPGVDVPLGGGYGHDFGPSFGMDGHVGLAIWMRGRRFALMPELSVGGTLLEGTGLGMPDTSLASASFSRVRGEAGLRVLVPLGHHLVVYPRVAVGGDYFAGQVSYDFTTPASRGPVLAEATASSFLCEAGGGLVATLGRHFALGAYVGARVTPLLRVSYDSMQGLRHLGDDRWTAVDLTASAALALRL